MLFTESYGYLPPAISAPRVVPTERRTSQLVGQALSQTRKCFFHHTSTHYLMLSSYRQRRVRRCCQWCPLIVGGRCMWIYMTNMSASYDFRAARRSYCKAHLSARNVKRPLPKKSVLLNFRQARSAKNHALENVWGQSEIVVERAAVAPQQRAGNDLLQRARAKCERQSRCHANNCLEIRQRCSCGAERHGVVLVRHVQSGIRPRGPAARKERGARLCGLAGATRLRGTFWR